MFSDIRRLYLYAVCFTALLLMIFSAIRLSGVLVEALTPVPPPLPPSPVGVLPRGEKEGVAAEQKRQEAYDRRRRIVEGVQSGVTLVIAVPIYLYHWRLARREDRD